MKLLIIDNAAMIDQGGHYCTNKLNGAFIEELMGLGHSVTCFQFARSSSNTISVYDLTDKGVNCTSISSKGNRVFRHLKAFYKMLRVITKTEFVYVYLPNTLKMAITICRILGKPYGVYVRGMKGLDNKRSIRIYSKAKAVFTVSSVFSKTITSLSGNKEVYLIKPMIPYTDLDIVEDRKYEIPKEFSILFLGRVAQDKGIGELLNAIKRLVLNDRFKLKLTVVGDGEFMNQTQEMVLQLGLSKWVEIVGPIFDDEIKKSCYLNASVYVLPTYHEGFPRTLYEAMIFGTPIITTFVGGIPSLMRDKENCLRIEPKSVDSIVEQLTFAIQNYRFMCQCAISARETVRPIIDHRRLTHAQQLDQLLMTIK